MNCVPQHTKCVPSRTRSVFHRAGSFLRSVAGWTREGAYFRSAAFSCRTRSVLHRAGSFLRSVAGWTREDMPTVLWRSLFRGFLIFRFEKILCSIYALYALDAGAHKVCSIVPEIFSVLWSAFVRYFTVAKRHLLQKQSPIAPKNLRGFGWLFE